MKKQILVVVGLVATAGVALAAAPFGPAGRGMGRGHGPGGGFGPDPLRFRTELKLTDAQVDQIRQIRTEQERTAIRRRADIALARLDLKNLLTGSTIDEKAVNLKVKELSDLEAAGRKARVDGFLAMRKVLTAEQIQLLRDLRPERGPRPTGDRRGRAPMGRGLGSAARGFSPDVADDSFADESLTSDETK